MDEPQIAGGVSGSKDTRLSAGPCAGSQTVPDPSTTFSFRTGESLAFDRRIAVERPVQISYADIPFGVMMMTPIDVDDFAYGFSFTEGIISSRSEVRACAVASGERGLKLDIDLRSMSLRRLLARRRSTRGGTGCGVCGVHDLDELVRVEQKPVVARPIDLDAIRRALTDLEDQQSLHRATGAVHAAAWASAAGSVSFIREDVGRHNALDKLIGALVKGDIDPATGFFVVTSRASLEMVEKAATFGASALVAVSAPTSMAIDRARELNLALLCIARSDSVTAFHGAERLVRTDRRRSFGAGYGGDAQSGCKS